VDNILKICSEKADNPIDIKTLVARKDFSLDAFKEGILYLLPSEEAAIKIERRPLTTSARVGLTLKRYDSDKDQFWMADYRFLTYPEKNKKMNSLIALSLMAKGSSNDEIARQTSCTRKLIEELRAAYKGAKREGKIKDFMQKSGEMKNKDFAEVYALHQQKYGSQ